MTPFIAPSVSATSSALRSRPRWPGRADLVRAAMTSRLDFRHGPGQTTHLLMLTAIRSSSPLPAWACPDPATWLGILDELVCQHG